MEKGQGEERGTDKKIRHLQVPTVYTENADKRSTFYDGISQLQN